VYAVIKPRLKDQMIPLSVIVPNYNSGTYLSDCIKSINSGVWPAEILIIDDCSTDKSLELAQNLLEQYSNIRLLRRQVNGGALEARRLGISESTQELIALVDADDFLEECALENAYKEISSSGADICIWDLWGFDEESKWRNVANPKDFPITGNESVLLTLGGWNIHAFGLYRKIVLEEAYEGFNETFFMADELLTRLAFSHASKVVGCEKKYLQRSHSQSSTRILSAKRLSSLRRHIWLLKFARNFNAAPIREMTCIAVWEAWFYWTQRKKIGVPDTLLELRFFLAGLYRCPGLLTLLFRRPKFLAGLLFLSIVVWTPF
jgi:glycosyltransferase involved in cell wall biosynthesis